MKSITVELFASVVNHMVIRAPGRRFPGVLIQGDSLHILYSLARKLQSSLKRYDDEDMLDIATELTDLLYTHLRVYEEALAKHDIDLPYKRE